MHKINEFSIAYHIKNAGEMFIPIEVMINRLNECLFSVNKDYKLY